MNGWIGGVGGDFWKVLSHGVVEEDLLRLVGFSAFCLLCRMLVYIVKIVLFKTAAWIG